MKLPFKQFIFASIALSFMGLTYAAPKPIEINVGDEAPAKLLEGLMWANGTPITEFKQGDTYVFYYFWGH